MALTEKMKAFCREYVANGGNCTDAYLVAYDTDSKTTASREGSLLLKREDISQYIHTLNLPSENKAITERQKKRDFLWGIIRDTTQDTSDKLRAMDILNRMDSEYVNINRNIEDTTAPIQELDTTTLLRLVE